MTRDDYLSGGESITFVPPMIRGVFEKETRGGAVFNFVNRSRGDKWIAKAAEGSKMSVCRIFVVEEECRGGVVFGFRRKYVENLGGHLKGMMPKGGWERGMGKESATMLSMDRICFSAFPF